MENILNCVNKDVSRDIEYFSKKRKRFDNNITTISIKDISIKEKIEKIEKIEKKEKIDKSLFSAKIVWGGIKMPTLPKGFKPISDYESDPDYDADTELDNHYEIDSKMNLKFNDLNLLANVASNCVKIV